MNENKDNSVRTHPSFAVISARFVEVGHDTHLFNQKVKTGQAVCIEVHRAEHITTTSGYLKVVPTTLIQRCITSHSEFANLVLNMSGGGISVTHQVMLDPNAPVSRVAEPDSFHRESKVEVNLDVLNEYKNRAAELQNRVGSILSSTGKKDIRSAIEDLRDYCKNISEALPQMSSAVENEFNRTSDVNRKIVEEKTKDKLNHFIQQKRIG